ncbi:MAG: IS256 family transposase [Pseudobdellovibrionaceae bacterium]|jgi:putative transposase
MLKVVPSKTNVGKEFEWSLDEIARQGARRLLIEALNLEVEEYINQNSGELDEDGNRLVVRNGLGKKRTVTLGSGAVDIQCPRVNDKRIGEKFSSSILPPYLRKSPKVESLIPTLYLKGLSTNDFSSALADIFGEGTMGLSPASIVKLKKIWNEEFEKWSKRLITKKYVYIWADGVNVQVRLGEDKKVCLLVIIGATENGEKELLAVHPGYRESSESWLTVLRSLIDRGMNAPMLAIGDGALGFWSAVRQCKGFEKTKEQRCWVHKIANVLDKLPKRVQADAKTLLHEMMMASTAADAKKSKESFEKLFSDKYPKAVDCLNKNWSELTTFFSYPSQHWQHIRTTNPIESAFATVKLRTKVTKGAGSKETATVMAFKLLDECQKKWRRLRGHEEIKNLLKGLEYKDGIMIPQKQHHEAAAS